MAVILSVSGSPPPPPAPAASWATIDRRLTDRGHDV